MRLILLTFVVGFSSLALAAPDERALAREHYLKGTKAFDLGLYEEAIAEYMAAYKAKDDPALLYNIAQSHRLAGHAADAQRFYRMYLRKIPDAPNRDEVEAKLAELQKLIDQQKKTQTMPPDQVKPLGSTPAGEPRPGPASTEPGPRPSAAEPKPGAVPAAEAPSPPPAEPPAEAGPPGHAGRTKKIAGLAVAGAGLAVAITGIALAATAGSLSNELGAADRDHGVYDPGKQSLGETLNVVGPVLAGVGGAAVVTGVVIAALGFREARAARMAVAPSLGPTHAGAVVMWSF